MPTSWRSALVELIVSLMTPAQLRVFIGLHHPALVLHLPGEIADAVRLTARVAELLVIHRQLDAFLTRLLEDIPGRATDIAVVQAQIEAARAQGELYAVGLGGLLHAGTLELPADPDARLPSQLLQAAYEVVPFVGREAELAELAAWCASDAPVAARLFTGAGGSGKTRLLIEACKRQVAADWAAGFLWGRDVLPADAVERLLTSEADRLVVLDYAETRRGLLTDLLKRAAGQAKGRLRVVLLARGAGDWWTELKRGDAHVGHLLSAQPRRLLPLFREVEERSERFVTAAEAMATAKGWPFPGPPAHDGLRDDVLGQPLYLWMAAFLALQGQQLSTAKKLLDETLAHEQRFWQRRLAEKGWALDIDELEDWVGPVVAGVTLLGGTRDRSEANEVAKAVGSLPAEQGRHQRTVVKMLRDLYPAPAGAERAWLMGVLPDVLGEHLVAQHLSKRLVTAVLAETFGGVASVLTIFTRLANRDPAQRRWIQIAFADPERLERCVSVAMEVAIETGDPIGILLAQQLGETPLVARLDELYAKCPEQTVALMEVADVLSKQRLEQLSVSEASMGVLGEDMMRLRERSVRLTSRSLRLSQIGQREAALGATEQALRIDRQLAAARPDAFLPALAGSFNNLGLRLSALGRHEDALVATEEATQLYRALTEARPDAFLPNLAASLNNLGNRLSALGRREDALVATEEATQIRRTLAETWPDAFLSDLATSLNNLGLRLSALGRFEAALAVTEEATQFHRTLAEDRPDAFLPNLATSLNNLGPSTQRFGSS